MKKIIALSLSMLMLFSTSVYANTKEVIVKNEDGILITYLQDTYNETLDSLSKSKRYGETEKSTVMDSKKITYTVTPEGQNPGGTRFGTVNSGFNIAKTSGSTITFSYSLPMAWAGVPLGSIGISLKPGIASTTMSGATITVPDTINYWKVKCDKTMLVEYVKVDCYQYGVYQYSYYTTWTSAYSDYFYCVKA